MRRLVSLLSIFVLAIPCGAIVTAQPVGRALRIGAVSSGGPEQERLLQADLYERLRERGWSIGQNVVIEWRYVEGNYEKAAELVHELVRLRCDVLMTRGGAVTTA